VRPARQGAPRVPTDRRVGSSALLSWMRAGPGRASPPAVFRRVRAAGKHFDLPIGLLPARPESRAATTTTTKEGTHSFRQLQARLGESTGVKTAKTTTAAAKERAACLRARLTTAAVHAQVVCAASCTTARETGRQAGQARQRALPRELTKVAARKETCGAM
jgi:hypothetical protein